MKRTDLDAFVQNAPKSPILSLKDAMVLGDVMRVRDVSTGESTGELGVVGRQDLGICDKTILHRSYHLRVVAIKSRHWSPFPKRFRVWR